MGVQEVFPNIVQSHSLDSLLIHLRTVAKEAEEAGAIRSGIRSVRLALQEAVGPLRAFEESAVNAFETGKAHSACECDMASLPYFI